MRLSKGLGAWPAAVTLVLLACGGKATVDEPLGAGGQGGDDSYPLCVTPEPNGPLTVCGSSASSGSCSTIVCDADGKGWESSCAGQACSCNYNYHEVQCSCSISYGTFCDGVTPSCCPAPFPP